MKKNTSKMEEQRFNKGQVYLTPCELSRKDILRMALESEQECEKLEKENALLRPEAELMDKALDADEKIDIGQVAKILELPYGRERLFKKLQDAGVFIKGRLRPHQEYIDRGYFTVKEKFIERSAHEGFMVLKILVTQKGFSFLSKLLDVVERRNGRHSLMTSFRNARVYRVIRSF